MATVERIAEEMCVDAGDVRVLIDMYPADVLDIWEEEGVLSRVASEDLHHVLSPVGERHIPEYYYRQPGWREVEAAEEEWWAQFER